MHVAAVVKDQQSCSAATRHYGIILDSLGEQAKELAEPSTIATGKFV